MAQLGSYYGLCPLIDSKSLLGISEDPERGVVIVTQGKNIACRYKLSDQKQISSWKTKETFCSPVIYDTKLSTYLAVINHSCIRLWNGDEENLDKLRKHKFKNKIYTLISDGDNTLIVFQNGAICTLTTALQMRRDIKLKQVISDVELIEDILYKKLNGDLYVGLIARSDVELNLYWTKFTPDTYKFSKIKLFRYGFTLKGCVFHIEGMLLSLLTLWSDARIFSYPLEIDKITQELYTSLKSISTKHNVSMLSLDENYIVIFGANQNDEGAVLIIYNTQFKIIQSMLPFKLFTDSAKLWRIDNNLLLPIGQNLAVVPFFLKTEQLAALIGSHNIMPIEKDVDISIICNFEVGSWNIKSSLKDTQKSKTDICKIRKYLDQGLPECTIIADVLPEIFEKGDIDTLTFYINHFSDIPEKYLAQILKYVITVENTTFSKKEWHLSKLFPMNLQPAARAELIDIILCKSFNHVLFIPYLQSELDFKDILLLMQYICFLWSNSTYILPGICVVKTKTILINWSFVLIDSHYQKFLLSKSELLRDILTELLALIKEHLHSLSDLHFFSKFFTNYNKKRNIACVKLEYSIEQISLFQ